MVQFGKHANCSNSILLSDSRILYVVWQSRGTNERVKGMKYFKKRKQKNLGDFMWPIYYGLGK